MLFREPPCVFPIRFFESPLFAAQGATRVGECLHPPLRTLIDWASKALLLGGNL